MKLLVPIEFYRKGGVERVILSLVEALAQRVEQIILVLPPKDIPYFQGLLPPSARIAYASLRWPPGSRIPLPLELLYRLRGLAQKLRLRFLETWCDRWIQPLDRESRLHELIHQSGATHCLYFLTNRLQPPQLPIPLAMIAHDLFWRFAPLTYPADYIQQYDDSLRAWLQACTVVFANSEKTRQDVLTVFPEFAAKVKAIPLAGFVSDTPIASELAVQSRPEGTVFYFPSSFGIYKDHLTLIKAGLKLASQGLKFKIVLVGRETDSLINGQLQLSQQDKSQEYADYLRECQQIYADHQPLLQQYFQGLGYCSHAEVEWWYQHCTCVVFPSRYEGFGLALSEAIVRGVPAIASDLNVFQEQVNLYQCGDRVSLFPVGDADALAERMATLIHQPQPRLSPEAARVQADRWTWEKVAQQYVEILQAS